MNKTLKIIFYAVIFIPFLMISGCAFPLGWDDSGRKYPLDTLLQGTEKSRTAYAREQESKEKYVKEHPEIEPEIKEQLLHGYIIKGMAKEQVQLFKQFSRPPDKIRTTTRYGSDEMWIFNFEDTNQRAILYFKSDILVYWKKD